MGVYCFIFTKFLPHHTRCKKSIAVLFFKQASFARDLEEENMEEALHNSSKGDFVVRQTYPRQHFNGLELKRLLADVRDRIWPVWLAENGHDPRQLLQLQYQFSFLGCFIDGQGQWQRSKDFYHPSYFQRLEIDDYAFWHSREEICTGLLRAEHLRNAQAYGSRVSYISAEAELMAYLYPHLATEQDTSYAVASA
jgi:hypothetical protein